MSLSSLHLLLTPTTSCSLRFLNVVFVFEFTVAIRFRHRHDHCVQPKKNLTRSALPTSSPLLSLSCTYCVSYSLLLYLYYCCFYTCTQPSFPLYFNYLLSTLHICILFFTFFLSRTSDNDYHYIQHRRGCSIRNNLSL